MSIFFHFPPLALDPLPPSAVFHSIGLGIIVLVQLRLFSIKIVTLFVAQKKCWFLLAVCSVGALVTCIAFVNWLLNALCVLVSMYYSHYQPSWVQIRSTSEKGFRAMPRLPRRYISRCLQACPPKYFTTMAAMQNCKNVAQILHTLFTYFKMLTGLSAKIFHNSGYDAKLQKNAQMFHKMYT